MSLLHNSADPAPTDATCGGGCDRNAKDMLYIPTIAVYTSVNTKYTLVYNICIGTVTHGYSCYALNNNYNISIIIPLTNNSVRIHE